MAGKNRQAQQERKEAKKELGRVVNMKFERELQPPVQAKNEKQKEFLRALKTHKVVVCSGPAGFGKSFLTMSQCTDWLKKGEYDKLILSRPAVGMGRTLGFLKGGLREKYEPYLMPCVDVVKQRYGTNFYENSLHNGVIEFAPLEFIRGRSFDQLVVVDECQNVTPDEMYTIITRVAEGGKLILMGDPTQNDLKGYNGIDWLCDFVAKHEELNEVIKVVKATSDDIVRSGLCKMMVKAKERDIV